MRLRLLIATILSNILVVSSYASDWIVTTYDESTTKEKRYRLNDKAQFVPLPGFEWRCLFPPQDEAMEGRVLIRSVQCSVLGSGRMIGGVAKCIVGAPSQPGSLNLVLHEGMNTKVNKFEFGKDHKSIAITLECSTQDTKNPKLFSKEK